MIHALQNKWKKRFFLCGFLLTCLFWGAAAQSLNKNPHIDSLISKLPAMMRSDETKARQMIQELGLQAKQLQHRHGIIQSLFFKAWLSYRHEPADIAIKSIDSSLMYVKGIQTDTALVNFYILKGQCYVKKTEFGPALVSFKQALKIAERRGDLKSKTGTLISIGWAYMEDGKPLDAIHFFNEVLRLNPSTDYESRAVVLCNIASCYNTIGKFSVAEDYAQKGISAATLKVSNMDLANGLNILARSYYQQGKMENAISILKKAARAREKVSDPSMLISDYLELANLYHKNAQHLQAIAWAKKAEALSGLQGNNLKLSAVYESLSSAYEAVGDHKNAFYYLKKLQLHKDSLSDDHYDKAFAEMQVQFESQKKTAENLRLKKENLEAKLQNSIQQRWLLLMAAGLVLLVASGIYISKLMKSRYNTRLALDQLNEQKNRTIAVIEAEEKERRRIAGDLHDGVGQTLAAASLQLIKARGDQRSLDKVDELISQACTEVRTLSHQVTPELLLHHGLVKALEQAVARLNDANNSTVFQLYTYIEDDLQDEMASITLYRCFQELCTNIIKHAHASLVTVQLNVSLNEVELMMEDNGVGFEPEKAIEGLGLKNMKSRIALFNGELIVDSTPGKGTTTIVRLQKNH